MKKFLAILLVLAVASAVFAGGNRQSSSSSQARTGPIRIGFAQCRFDESDWRMANTRSMLDTFNTPGYLLTMADSNNDAAKQVSDVQAFIDMEYDYIVIAAVNMDGWDTVLRNAQRAGIPVILVDRNISPQYDNLWTCYVGPDFKVEGQKATAWIEKHYGTRQVNIVNLQGQLGSGAQIGRSAALDEAVTKNSNWTLLARQTGDWSTDVAKQVTTSWIQQFGSRINVVYAENDNMADGAIQALQEAGIRVGGADGVSIISFDANRPYLQMTLQGLINVNVECNPLHGPRVKEIIDTIERGQTPSKIQIIDEDAFYWDTITQAIINARQY
jgi:simple sugar transport system substrate-binding protein